MTETYSDGEHMLTLEEFNQLKLSGQLVVGRKYNILNYEYYATSESVSRCAFIDDIVDGETVVPTVSDRAIADEDGNNLKTAIASKQSLLDESQLTTTAKTVVGAVNELNTNKNNKPTIQKFVVDTSIWTIQPTISGSLDASFKASPEEFYFVTLKDIDKSVTEASAVFTSTTIKITETTATFAIGDEISIAYSSIYQNNNKATITNVSNNGTQTTYTFAASTWTAGTSTTDIIMATTKDLPANQFKLIYFKDCPASMINQVFTLADLNTGIETLIENFVVDFKQVGIGWQLRNGGYYSISLDTNSKNIKIRTNMLLPSNYYLYMKLSPYNTVNYYTYSMVSGGYSGINGFLMGNLASDNRKFIQKLSKIELNVDKYRIHNSFSVSTFCGNSLTDRQSLIGNTTPYNFEGALWNINNNILTENITRITFGLGSLIPILNGSEIIVEEYNE